MHFVPCDFDVLNVHLNLGDENLFKMQINDLLSVLEWTSC